MYWQIIPDGVVNIYKQKTYFTILMEFRYFIGSPIRCYHTNSTTISSVTLYRYIVYIHILHKNALEIIASGHSCTYQHYIGFSQKWFIYTFCNKVHLTKRYLKSDESFIYTNSAAGSSWDLGHYIMSYILKSTVAYAQQNLICYDRCTKYI